MNSFNIILAGCGEMSNTWLDYITQRNNAKIVGLVDVNIHAATKMAKRRHLDVQIFSDLTKALKETEANLVIDVTVPSAHKQIVTTSLEEGCHVFGEKPMAESIEDALAILKVSRQTGNKYSVMQNRRYIKEIRALRHGITCGTIGTLTSVHANFFIGAHFGGFRDVMDHPLILDMAIHTFDQARFISGANPVSVYCHEYNPMGSWYKGNASAVCIFEMSDGSVFTYNGSWCAEGMNTSWDSDWRIIGTEGSIFWNGVSPPMCEIIDKDKELGFINPMKKIELPCHWEGREGHWGCLDEMFASLEQDRLAETDCNDNINSMKMVFGAIESAKTGKKIKL